MGLYLTCPTKNKSKVSDVKPVKEGLLKQSVSHYVMPGDNEEELISHVRSLGLHGIENLIYGYEAAETPFTRATVGTHLKYWPTWMDFYLGRKDMYEKDYPTEQSLIDCYGGATPADWIEHIKLNVKAALAEQPEYMVWHVADCRVAETWTHDFHYTSEEVLAATAEIYAMVSEIVPDDVYVLFENIFWPGLHELTPYEVDYFFSRLPYKNVGIMLDTGHYMNMNWDLRTEEDGARHICRMVEELGDMKSLIKGMHLSCSLSGEYQRHVKKCPPKNPDMERIFSHITAIDQHQPFETDAARRIVDAVEPLYLTHELFTNGHQIPEDALRKQMKYL